MRQIKFRAWDKEKKEMYKPTHEAYKGNLFELMVGFNGDLLAHTMVGVEHESKFPDRFELMQFTGLLDKNGKEICEGDIIKWEQYKGWNKNKVYYLASGFYADTTAFKDDLNSPTSINLASALDCEIIGNIYENPELI